MSEALQGLGDAYVTASCGLRKPFVFFRDKEVFPMDYDSIDINKLGTIIDSMRRENRTPILIGDARDLDVVIGRDMEEDSAMKSYFYRRYCLFMKAEVPKFDVEREKRFRIPWGKPWLYDDVDSGGIRYLVSARMSNIPDKRLLHEVLDTIAKKYVGEDVPYVREEYATVKSTMSVDELFLNASRRSR